MTTSTQRILCALGVAAMARSGLAAPSSFNKNALAVSASNVPLVLLTPTPVCRAIPPPPTW